MRQFTTAARRGESAVPRSVDVEFEWELTEGVFVPMVAHPPTTGQIALFSASTAMSGRQSVRSLFQLLSSVLDEKSYAIIEGQLHDGLDVQVLVELIEFLVEEWGARPTPRPSASASSPSSNGQRSTVKRRAAASTTSN